MDKEFRSLISTCSAPSFRNLRKRLGFSGTDMGKILGVTVETISRWETGKQPVPLASFALLSLMAQEHLQGKSDLMLYLLRLQQ